MLSRKVLEKIIEKNPGIKYSRNPEETYLPESLYRFLKSDINADTNKYETGDVYICDTLRDMGALLFVDARLQIGVKGYENFVGSYMENLVNRRGVVDDQGIEGKGMLSMPQQQQQQRPAVPETPPISVVAENVILTKEDPSGATTDGETKKKRKRKKKKKKR